MRLFACAVGLISVSYLYTSYLEHKAWTVLWSLTVMGWYLPLCTSAPVAIGVAWSWIRVLLINWNSQVAPFLLRPVDHYCKIVFRNHFNLIFVLPCDSCVVGMDTNLNALCCSKFHWCWSLPDYWILLLLGYGDFVHRLSPCQRRLSILRVSFVIRCC